MDGQDAVMAPAAAAPPACSSGGGSDRGESERRGIDVLFDLILPPFAASRPPKQLL
jgi:hypothetical protein